MTLKYGFNRYSIGMYFRFMFSQTSKCAKPHRAFVTFPQIYFSLAIKCIRLISTLVLTRAGIVIHRVVIYLVFNSRYVYFQFASYWILCLKKVKLIEHIETYQPYFTNWRSTKLISHIKKVTMCILRTWESMWSHLKK